MKELLRVENLNAGYGDMQVLWDVSLEVKEGEIVALVGSNGAGKTTFFRAITGLIKPYSGKVIYQGKDITGTPAEKTVSLGIAMAPEGRHLFAGMTVEENLLMGAFHRKDREQVKKDLEWVYKIFPVLKERKKQLAGDMSGGEQQMCAIGRALMANPKLLLIDELSLGLAPVIVDVLINVVKDIRDMGKTVLIVEQDVQVALEIADRGYVIETGRITYHGEAKKLLEMDEIKQAYLGI